MSKQKEINVLERQRSKLLRAITNIFPMIPGSYKKVYRKCGKMNCWCHASASGHSFKRITWKKQGASRTKVVADDHIEWVLGATENYRKFHAMIASLQQIEIRLHEMLQKLAVDIIDKSRRENPL
jgi:hypothetical protein